MAKKYTVYNSSVGYTTMSMDKDSATVIVAGDLVGIDGSDEAIVALATSTKVAYAPNGAAAGDLSVEVTVGNDFLLKGTGDAVFADTMKGDLVDINSTTQTIDVGVAVTNVLQHSAAEEAGVVGSADDMIVRINLPIF